MILLSIIGTRKLVEKCLEAFQQLLCERQVLQMLYRDRDVLFELSQSLLKLSRLPCHGSFSS